MVLMPLNGLFHKWEKYEDTQTDRQVPPVDLLDAGKKEPGCMFGNSLNSASGTLTSRKMSLTIRNGLGKNASIPV